MDSELEEWIKTRPTIIQKMAQAHPPDGEYKIAEGAPYSITCPGTIVFIIAYSENGTIRVGVMAEDLLPAAVEHGKRINPNYVPSGVISAYVDPQYLIPITAIELKSQK